MKNTYRPFTTYLPFKTNHMPELKLTQLQYETETWKRQLGFMKDENIHLKIRISEILKDSFENNLLEEVENFQTSFIKEDELIGHIRKDIAEIDKLLVKDFSGDENMIHVVDRSLKKLRNNMIHAEKQFSKLKSEFNSFLYENI